MSPLILSLKDIKILKKAHSKLYEHKRLSSDERHALTNFLDSLPPPEKLLIERFPLGETFATKVFDIEEMWPQLNNWIKLFNDLPKNGSKFHPNAGLLDVENNSDFWKNNIIITGSFVPSLAYSRKDKGKGKIIGFNLKTDGTATFEFWTIEDAENFPDLYRFKGSWKEAYLLVAKTLQQGWPQTRLPEELLPLLKK